MVGRIIAVNLPSSCQVQNCGQCENACNDGETCNAGTCEASCGDLGSCNGNCVDLSSDVGGIFARSLIAGSF